ncbi:MAG: hypothetical protein M3Y87_17585, partial [Myxococcota bacterium]|nr:hypothetical protein [Myxococcota bacterium]
MRRSLFIVLLGALVACAPPERRLEWGYVFDPVEDARAPVQLVASLQDGCDAGAREVDRWIVGQSAPAMERRSGEPALALSLRAVAGEPGCPVYASGCAVLGEGRTMIVLRPTPGARICPGDGLCAQLACEVPRDAGAIEDA